MGSLLKPHVVVGESIDCSQAAGKGSLDDLSDNTSGLAWQRTVRSGKHESSWRP